MSAFRPLAPVVPVIFLIGLGFAFAHWKKINLASVTEIIVYLAAPALVFTSLAGRPLVVSEVLTLVAGVAGIFAGVGFLITLYFRIFAFRSRGFALPVLFMNAGNMGIPLGMFAFGQTGLQRATLLWVIVSLLQYSLGIYILRGRADWLEVFRLPLIYATVLGLVVNLNQLEIPRVILEPLSMLGLATIPLMLVSLGYRLHDTESLQWGHSLGGAALRIGGGFTAAYVTVTLIGAEGVNRQLLLLYGALPSAVVNFVLTEKYGQDPQLAASIVILSTFSSVATIPLVLWFTG